MIDNLSRVFHALTLAYVDIIFNRSDDATKVLELVH